MSQSFPAPDSAAYSGETPGNRERQQQQQNWSSILDDRNITALRWEEEVDGDTGAARWGHIDGNSITVGETYPIEIPPWLREKLARVGDFFERHTWIIPLLSCFVILVLAVWGIVYAILRLVLGALWLIISEPMKVFCPRVRQRIVRKANDVKTRIFDEIGGILVHLVKRVVELFTSDLPENLFDSP